MCVEPSCCKHIRDAAGESNREIFQTSPTYVSLEASASHPDLHCLPCTGLDTIIGISSTIIETSNRSTKQTAGLSGN
jgi:hypothetical protein